MNVLGNKYSVPWKVSGRTTFIRLEGESFTVVVEPKKGCKHRLVPGTGHEERIEGHRAGLLAASHLH